MYVHYLRVEIQLVFYTHRRNALFYCCWLKLLYFLRNLFKCVATRGRWGTVLFVWVVPTLVVARIYFLTIPTFISTGILIIITAATVLITTTIPIITITAAAAVSAAAMI